MKVQPTLGSSYSGSLRGITASHNRGGVYFRGRTVPVNPNSSRQQSIRAVFGALTQRWSETLTDSQRQAWRSYAENVTVTDALGNEITLTGLNMYLRGNSARRQAADRGVEALAAIDDGPTIFNTGVGVASITAFSGDFTTPPGTIGLTFGFSEALTAAGDVFLYVAPPQTPATTFYKGPYQLALTAATTATLTSLGIANVDLSMSAEWNSDTVPVVGWDGLTVPLRAVIVTDDGRRSQIFEGFVPFTDATP